MSPKAQHTPGELVVWVEHFEIYAGPVKANEPGSLRGGRGMVATTESDDFDDDESLANAAELVRRWNAHEDLVAALTELLSSTRNTVGAQERARAALAKAVKP